jgi:hypothetical protein
MRTLKKEISFLIIGLLIITTLVIGALDDEVPMEITLGNQFPNISILELNDDTPGDSSMLLWPNTTQKIYCWGYVFEVDGYDDLTNAFGRIWDEGNYNYWDPQNNKYQYRNDSCAYSPTSEPGANAMVNCTFDVWFYANYSDWNCTITINDTFNHLVNSSGNATMEQIVAVDITNSTLNWSTVSIDTDYDPYVEFNVENEGNVRLDIEVDAYNNTATGTTDTIAFECDIGTIAVNRIAFNLTNASTGAVYGESTLLDVAGVVSSPQFDLVPQDGTFNIPTNRSGFLGINVPGNPMINGTCNGFLRVNGVNDEP